MNTRIIPIQFNSISLLYIFCLPFKAEKRSSQDNLSSSDGGEGVLEI